MYPSRWCVGLLFTFLNVALSMTTLDYCLLSCDGQNHTMCDYPPGGGPACDHFQSGLTEEEERMIMDLHNSLRQSVATGAESLEQPPASDMLEVIWDREAAIIAQRWADQCDLLGHDRCRRTLHEVHVGQNIAWMKGVDYPGRTKSRADVIEYFITGWFREVDHYDGQVESWDPTDQELPRIAHYTQLVWAATAELGCGFVQWETDIEYEYKLVCNYLPGGNMRGDRVYRRGDPCTECPPFTKCSDRWPGLCEADDWSKNGDVLDIRETPQKDLSAVNQSDISETPQKDLSAVNQPDISEPQKELIEGEVEDPVETTDFEETTKQDASEASSDFEKEPHLERENDFRKGHGHALRSFLFVTVFTVFLHCYIFKIATVN